MDDPWFELNEEFIELLKERPIQWSDDDFERWVQVTRYQNRAARIADILRRLSELA